MYCRCHRQTCKVCVDQRFCSYRGIVHRALLCSAYPPRKTTKHIKKKGERLHCLLWCLQETEHQREKRKRERERVNKRVLRVEERRRRRRSGGFAKTRREKRRLQIRRYRRASKRISGLAKAWLLPRQDWILLVRYSTVQFIR